MRFNGYIRVAEEEQVGGVGHEQVRCTTAARSCRRTFNIYIYTCRCTRSATRIRAIGHA